MITGPKDKILSFQNIFEKFQKIQKPSQKLFIGRPKWLHFEIILFEVVFNSKNAEVVQIV